VKFGVVALFRNGKVAVITYLKNDKSGRTTKISDDEFKTFRDHNAPKGGWKKSVLNMWLTKDKALSATRTPLGDSIAIGQPATLALVRKLSKEHQAKGQK
jgi:hypothetical protein